MRFSSSEKMRGGSQPALIRCNDGKLYVVKFFNNPQGSNVLANEVLGNELLSALNLPSPSGRLSSFRAVSLKQILECFSKPARIFRNREWITFWI